MPFTFTDLLHLAMPARGDRNWDADVSRVFQTLDAALNDLGGRPRFFDKRVVAPGSVSVDGRNVSIAGVEAVPNQVKTTLAGGAVVVPTNPSRKPRVDALSIDPAAPNALVLTQGDPAAFGDREFRTRRVFDKNNTNLSDFLPEGGIGPILGLFHDPVHDRLVAMVMAGTFSVGGFPMPTLFSFDPETGQFSDLGVSFRSSEAFKQDAADIRYVLPFGCAAPNEAGTDASWFFLTLLDFVNDPMSFSLCEFDASGLLIHMYGVANAKGNLLFGYAPFNMRFLRRGASNERRFEAQIGAFSFGRGGEGPLVAEFGIASPPAPLKMFGSNRAYGSVTARAATVGPETVKCLDARGDRLLMPGSGLSETGFFLAGGLDGGLFRDFMKAPRSKPPVNSVQDGGPANAASGPGFAAYLQAVLNNASIWDWNAWMPAQPLAAPVTPSNEDQFAMSAPVNLARLYFADPQPASIRLVIGSGLVGLGLKAPPPGKQIVVHIKNAAGVDGWWEGVLADFGGGEIGVVLDDAHAFRGSAPSDYGALNGAQGQTIRLGVRLNNGNNYDERVFNLTGVHEDDVGKPVLCVYDDGDQKFEFVSHMCAEGEERGVFADTDELTDDWLGPLYREANRGDVHMSWNVLDSANAESAGKSATMTPLVMRQETGFILLARYRDRPLNVEPVVYAKNGATGTWLDPNAVEGGGPYRLVDATLVSSSGLPQKSGGGTNYAALDPAAFSCALLAETVLFTSDVLTDPSRLSVSPLPHNVPLVEKARIDARSILGATLGVARFRGGWFAAGLTLAGLPAGTIVEFDPFEGPAAPDVPPNHIKVGEVLVPPDEESAEIALENVRTAPDRSEETASRADQYLSFLLASQLNNDLKNLPDIISSFSLLSSP